jgi:hypothetical protein
MNRRSFLLSTAGASAGLLMLPLLRPAEKLLARMDEPEAFSGREKFDQLLKVADEREWRKLPIGQLVAEIGLELRGIPYVSNTLELSDEKEFCSINLLGLDCVTFFESALAFARMLKKGERTPEAMMAQVRHTRYRNGRVGDYTSRLHYTTDWFYNNEEKRVVKVVTRELPGATRFTQKINFMSTHPDAYRQLKANPKLVPAVVETERLINRRKMYYVPKEKVAAAEAKLQTGDILGITTKIAGIDCAHTGLCYRDKNGTLRFLHASQTKKVVMLDEELSVYLAGVSKHTGIMVARPV